METPPPTELLQKIAQCSQDLAKRRGEHAAAIWAVGDFLKGLKGCLVEYRDANRLTNDGSRLAVLPLNPQREDPSSEKDSRSERWGIFVVNDEAQVPAYRADPEVLVQAVRRLPEFLAGYAVRLQAAAGSKLSLDIARQWVEAVTQTSPEERSPNC